ncbi:MAG: AAA family ATPase [Chloroflexi bacterium]|nr:AAA family ATPase [Chloroflexota bacterium]
MITNITLENFKCFRKVEVNPRRITVFIGANGTGKSSVLQAMALLKQSIGSNVLIAQGNLVDLTNPQSIVTRQRAGSSTTQISFGGLENQPELPGINFDEEVQFIFVAKFLVSGTVNLTFGEIRFSLEDQPFLIEALESTDYFTVGIDFGGYGPTFNRTKEIARLVQYAGWSGESHPTTARGIVAVVDSPNSVLRKLRFVHSARGLVRSAYRLEDARVDDISLTHGLSQQEQQIATNLGYSRQMEGELSNLLKKVTGVGLRADTVPAQSVEVKSLTSQGAVNIVSEGFGTNALIPLFLQLISAEEGSTVMIEEPEIHLHPKAQAELASVLVEEAQAEDKQIIMTTHSEHILGRLLTLVAEKKLAADELAIYAFEKDEKGECTASQIEVLDDGRVRGGIKDFFEPHLEELNRYIQAQFSGLQPAE